MGIGDSIKLTEDFQPTYGRVVEGSFITTPDLRYEEIKGQVVKIVNFNLWTLNPIVEFRGKKYEIDLTWIEGYKA